MRQLALLFILIMLPQFALAAVSITEVAWMGDAESANNEWIELYNSGSASIDLDGWTLTDTGTLNIVLSGTIAAGEYAVLERNRSSERYINDPPFLTYTGALVNTGTTLTLRRPNGIEDQVAGGENWENIGGDNASKATAQYTATKWITAVATPGQSSNESVPVINDGSDNDDNDVEEEEEEETKTAKKSSSNSSETIPLVLPEISLSLDLTIQSLAYVNQTVAFSAEPKGVGKTIGSSLTYEWNFGDLATATGKDVVHVYRYPGKYIVTLYAGYKRQTHVSRHEITVLPVTLSMTKNAAGDIQLHNDAPYDLDVSGYQMVGGTSVTFPPRSYMLPRSTITIPRDRVGITPSGSVVIYDNQGMIAGSMKQPTANRLAFVANDNVAVSPPARTVTTYSESTTSDDVGTAFRFSSGSVPDTLGTHDPAASASSADSLPVAETQEPLLMTSEVADIPTEPVTTKVSRTMLLLVLVAVIGGLLLTRRSNIS